jgi:gluconokinase
MNAPYVLALDIGTSSTRSAIYDAKARRVADTTAQFRYPLVTAPDGQAELRPEDLNRAVHLAFDFTLKAWRKRKMRAPLAGIAVSCFWHSLLGVDAQGRALTPIYTWADSRSWPDAQLLRKSLGEKAIHAQTGCMARASFWPAKLLWLRRTKPRLFRRVTRWVSPAEWMQQQWCGSATASLSMASGTGLLDGRTLRWHRTLLRRCGVTEKHLNPLSDEPIRVSKSGARQFSELAGVPWYPALGDGAASNLGSGATSPGIAAINVGTSAALRVVVADDDARSRRSLAPFGLFAYRIDARRRVLGGAISNAGNLRAWALRELKLPANDARMEKLLRSRRGPVDHLTVLPFWMAERAPTWPENIPSAILGITQTTSALDLLQSLEEATYHRLAQIAEKVENALGRKLTFVVSGGIHRSPDAMQRLANVLGRAVQASREPEASLRGAACFALEKLGRRLPAVKPGKDIRPEPAAVRAYLKARREQVRLEALLQSDRVAEGICRHNR